ncbi:MAG: VapE domain-containing protein [Bacteroidia bacterium]
MKNYFINQVSYYLSLRNTDAGVTQTMASVLKDIKEGKWRLEIERLRSLKDVKEKKSYKESLPLFTASGLFDERKDSGLIQHSRFLILDLDKLPNVEATRMLVNADATTAFSFVSCGGNGLAVGVIIDPNRHRESFEFWKDYYFTKYGLRIDVACKDVSRARLVSYDEQLYINTAPTVIEVPLVESTVTESVISESAQQPNAEVSTFTDEQKFVFCKRVIDKKLQYTDGNRHDYLWNLFAFCNKVGVTYTYISQKAEAEFEVPTKNKKEIESLLRSCYKKVEYFGTFKVNGGSSENYQWDEKLKPVYRYAHKKNKEGKEFTDEDVDFIAENTHVALDVAKAVLTSVYETHIAEFGLDKKAEIVKVENYIQNEFDLQKNEITQQIEFRKKGSDKYETLNPDTIYRQLQHAGYKFPLTKLNSLLQSDFIPVYNPFTDYFESLPVWDGEDYISELAEHVTCDDQEFFNMQFKKALVRCIACACFAIVNRMVVVFVSEKQEIGKSSFIRFLNPFGEKYYTEASLRDNKDSEVRLSENFIYNLEELSSLSSIDVNKLKAIISIAVIKERRPYAKNEVEAPRRCNFFGSTNKEEFLTDTENTRWLCFTVDNIDWNYSTNVDIHKVWGQAYHLYKTGFRYTLTKEEQLKREERNKSFEMSSNESDLLNRYFKTCKVGQGNGGKFYTIPELIEYLSKTPDGKNVNHNRYSLGRALSQSGFKQEKRRVNQKHVRGYWMKEVAGMDDVGPKLGHHPVFNFD